VAKIAELRRFSDQPVSEIVQSGEPARKASYINKLQAIESAWFV